MQGTQEILAQAAGLAAAGITVVSDVGGSSSGEEIKAEMDPTFSPRPPFLFPQLASFTLLTIAAMRGLGRGRRLLSEGEGGVWSSIVKLLSQSLLHASSGTLPQGSILPVAASCSLLAQWGMEESAPQICIPTASLLSNIPLILSKLAPQGSGGGEGFPDVGGGAFVGSEHALAPLSLSLSRCFILSAAALPYITTQLSCSVDALLSLESSTRGALRVGKGALGVGPGPSPPSQSPILGRALLKALSAGLSLFALGSERKVCGNPGAPSAELLRVGDSYDTPQGDVPPALLTLAARALALHTAVLKRSEFFKGDSSSRSRYQMSSPQQGASNETMERSGLMSEESSADWTVHQGGSANAMASLIATCLRIISCALQEASAAIAMQPVHYSSSSSSGRSSGTEEGGGGGKGGESLTAAENAPLEIQQKKLWPYLNLAFTLLLLPSPPPLPTATVFSLPPHFAASIGTCILLPALTLFVSLTPPNTEEPVTAAPRQPSPPLLLLRNALVELSTLTLRRCTQWGLLAFTLNSSPSLPKALLAAAAREACTRWREGGGCTGAGIEMLSAALLPASVSIIDDDDDGGDDASAALAMSPPPSKLSWRLAAFEYDVGTLFLSAVAAGVRKWGSEGGGGFTDLSATLTLILNWLRGVVIPALFPPGEGGKEDEEDTEETSNHPPTALALEKLLSSLLSLPPLLTLLLNASLSSPAPLRDSLLGLGTLCGELLESLTRMHPLDTGFSLLDWSPVSLALCDALSPAILPLGVWERERARPALSTLISTVAEFECSDAVINALCSVVEASDDAKTVAMRDKDWPLASVAIGLEF